MNYVNLNIQLNTQLKIILAAKVQLKNINREGNTSSNSEMHPCYIYQGYIPARKKVILLPLQRASGVAFVHGHRRGEQKTEPVLM